MSFRDLRNFTEIMRSLGYPRLISVENFRTPCFELVADCLYWLVNRYDPTYDIPDDIATEQDRVHFLKSVAQTMAVNARIKLNIKRLYGADGFAVKELLKIATVLYQAMRTSINSYDEDESGTSDLLLSSSKISSATMTRDLSQHITEEGAKLADLLSAEEENRDIRQKVIDTISSTQFDLQDIKKTVEAAIDQLETTMEERKSSTKSMVDDEDTLKQKIERSKADLKRRRERVSQLTAERPAYMDELERLEVQMQKHYEQYLERFRNLDYLEHELEEYNQQEMEKIKERDRQMARMQKKLREEELRILRGEQDIDYSLADAMFDEQGSSSDEDDYFGENKGGMRRPDAARSVRKGGESYSQVVGSMAGGDSDDSDSDDEEQTGHAGSSDSEVSFNSGASGVIDDDEDDNSFSGDHSEEDEDESLSDGF